MSKEFIAALNEIPIEALIVMNMAGFEFTVNNGEITEMEVNDDTIRN